MEDKLYQVMEFPTPEDTQKACEMVDPSRPSGIYTNDERSRVMKLAREIMMRRKTIQ